MQMAEIVFFDVETTVPVGACRRFWIVEFGAILVCPKRLVELDSYRTLIRPGDLSAVSETTGRCDGITRQAVASAPAFEGVADRIFEILNGRVWAGHNIRRFDSARIREAFAEIGRPAPAPIGMMDSLSVLAAQFGRRAGNLKVTTYKRKEDLLELATLGTYFGLGQQKHRSIEDVRMNLEVLKHCATVLLLESSLPCISFTNNASCHSIMTRCRANANSCGEEASKKSPPTSPPRRNAVPYTKKSKVGRVH